MEACLYWGRYSLKEGRKEKGSSLIVLPSSPTERNLTFRLSCFLALFSGELLFATGLCHPWSPKLSPTEIYVMERMHISNKDQQDYNCLIGRPLIKLTNRFKRFVLFSFLLFSITNNNNSLTRCQKKGPLPPLGFLVKIASFYIKLLHLGSVNSFWPFWLSKQCGLLYAVTAWLE